MKNATASACAIVNGYLHTDLSRLTNDPVELDAGGFWVVMLPYDGELLFAQFAQKSAIPEVVSPWKGPYKADWNSSLSSNEHSVAVSAILDYIKSGDVYQVNLCRILSAPLIADDFLPLAVRLRNLHSAQYQAFLQIPEQNVAVISASPECFLSRDGLTITTQPIKGTTPNGKEFLPKDFAENVMIVDLMRNDLGRICQVGSVITPSLFQKQELPGLNHLVSTVSGQLRPKVTWKEIFDATFPPGSVTGAPKLAACQIIEKLEPVSRGPYTGALGWIDADRDRAELGVSIRTFWRENDKLCFGTGGGITCYSTSDGEWKETELKAQKLIQLVSQ